ncbi:hypothetical protein BZG36_00568 [Bifiguratus adelaidae]|uniref:NodB homology domain-containing protein n=1 Tax=Bifiguratus adelaidae TaxID=1938954 RepID=A0A261Y7J8_9FUNG|nr:hypothetical protein BZG36_00568 [Bifiguratus adelaidae]
MIAVKDVIVVVLVKMRQARSDEVHLSAFTENLVQCDKASIDKQQRRKRSTSAGVVVESCNLSKTIALTFDDGPSDYTPELLDTLKLNGIHAIFFINWENWKPRVDVDEILKRMLREGHTIGSHAYSHVDLTQLDVEGIRAQLTKLHSEVKRATGNDIKYFRPPYGNVNDNVIAVCKDLGYQIVLWSIDVEDYKYAEAGGDMSAPIAEFKKALADSSKGYIALQHDTYKSVVENLIPAVINMANQT